MTICVVGVGLIGGSFALGVKERSIAKKVIGVGNDGASLLKAMQLGIIDEVMPLEEAVRSSKFIYVAIPVDATITVTSTILDMITPQQTVADAGSTKEALCRMLADHPNRHRLVASHPMWGTEFSGPEAAVKSAFTGKAVVICEKEKSAPDALELVEGMYRQLGMHIVYMHPVAHDMHAAYVSHISHISSFALANTVLEKEKEEDAIFELAGGGFESTVRLAKSNPDMWVPVFRQNKENVLDVLNEHIVQLRKFKSSLEKENWDYLYELIGHANKIKRILK
jgi:prephenate dehydrogenase